LATAAFSIACGSSTTNARLYPYRRPLIIASSAVCSPDGRSPAGKGPKGMALLVAKDAELLKDALGAEVVLSDDGRYSGAPTESRVREAVAKSSDDRGFLLFYSGHGYRTDGGPSQICVYSDNRQQGVLVSARSLVQTEAGMPRSDMPSPPWAVAVLNSCSSAYVDLRYIGRPTAVISAGHQDVSAAEERDAIGERGTLVAHLLEEILAGEDEQEGPHDAPGGPDSNCDGILTDYELFSRLSTALARVYPDAGADPPVFNLRRSSRSHVPLPLDGVPRPSKGCKDTDVRQRISELANSLGNATDTLALDLAHQLKNQLLLAEELGRSGPAPRSTPLPLGTHDYYVVEPPDDSVERLVGKAGLARFPGTRAQAELVANYAIFAEVYLFQPTGPDRVRVLRLRKEPGPFLRGREAGERLLRSLSRQGLPGFARGLALRVSIIARGDDDTLELLVADRLDEQPFEVEADGGPIWINPQDLKLVACEEGEGQCFAYHRR
jgi:hypothetical protein